VRHLPAATTPGGDAGTRLICLPSSHERAVEGDRLMAGWILIACLKELFAEFDRIAAGRDHASDGSIGDTAHQQEVSDHNPDETGSVPIHDADHINEVHAIDVDDDLNESSLSMEMVVQFLLGRCRSGAEKRLRYIIYNRRIWEASNGWKQRTYTGSSPHTEHAHFSASYDTAKEAGVASWHLEDIPVALTADDKKWLTSQIQAVMQTKVVVGDEQWQAGTAIGYAARETFEVQKALPTVDEIADAVAARLTAQPEKS
jgi:hypothetical protein